MKATAISPQNKYRIKKRLWAINLLGGKCVRCGSTERLEFDHIVPEEKSFNIAHIITYRKEKIIPELNKCRLLCKPCHTTVSIFQRGRKIATHGMASMYAYWGCRCAACRKAWAARRRAYYWKKKSAQST